MRWVDTVLLFDSLAAFVVGLLLYFTLRKEKKTAPEWALVGLFASQLTWILSDGLSVLLAIHFDFISDFHGGITGLAVVGMVVAAYLFCELYPDWPPPRFFEARLTGSLLIALPFLFFVFTPYWVADRRVVDGVKVGDPGPVFLLMGAWAVAMVAQGMTVLAIRYRRLRDARLRRNIRLIALGLVLNLVLSLLASYVLPLLGVPQFDFIGPVAAIVFVSLILYAISFHRLFDIETAALGILLHSFVGLAIGGALLTLLGWIGGEGFAMDGLGRPVVWLLAGFFFLGGALYDRVLKPRVDRLLHRSPGSSEKVLLELLSGRAFDLRHVRLEELCREILEALETSLGNQSGFILAVDRFDRPVFATRGDMREVRRHFPGGLARLFGRRLPEKFLRNFDGVFLLERGSGRAPVLAPGDAGELARLYPRIGRALFSILDDVRGRGVPLFVPLLLNQEVAGFLLLGEKNGGRPYFDRDLDLLSGIRTSIALAIRNFTYYEELSVMKSRAEAEVEKLTELISEREAVQRSVQGRTLLYSSPAMEDVLQNARRAAQAGRQPVLVLGETGTGKELFARMIHETAHAKEPFVAVNCAAVPAQLWEDDIFGHVRGAFTDARSDRAGKVEEAADGTLFFDEIGEMPLEMQAKMLRLLQERTYARIGSDKQREARCRFIFATNRSLESMIAEGTFRQDLYYRINVFTIEIPPLRSRAEDVPLLVRHFLETYGREPGFSPVEKIEESAMDALSRHSWPGNVRELENVLIRALAGARDGVLKKEYLPPHLLVEETGGARRPGRLASPRDGGVPDEIRGNFRDLVRDYRRSLIEAALSRSDGNKTMAAEYLGIKRTTLNSQIRELDIEI